MKHWFWSFDKHKRCEMTPAGSDSAVIGDLSMADKLGYHCQEHLRNSPAFIGAAS
jgi:hypothetical protein